GIALVVDRGDSSTGCAGTGGAIVIAFKRDAEALVLGRLRRFGRGRSLGRNHGKRSGQSAGQRQRWHRGLAGHASVSSLLDRSVRGGNALSIQPRECRTLKYRPP